MRILSSLHNFTINDNYTLHITRQNSSKTEGKRPLGKPKLKWENNIKMDVQEVGCGGMDWIELD
jgi:hypothetical protein